MWLLNLTVPYVEPFSETCSPLRIVESRCRSSTWRRALLSSSKSYLRSSYKHGPTAILRLFAISSATRGARRGCSYWLYSVLIFRGVLLEESIQGAAHHSRSTRFHLSRSGRGEARLSRPIRGALPILQAFPHQA